MCCSVHYHINFIGSTLWLQCHRPRDSSPNFVPSSTCLGSWSSLEQDFKIQKRVASAIGRQAICRDWRRDRNELDVRALGWCGTSCWQFARCFDSFGHHLPCFNLYSCKHWRQSARTERFRDDLLPYLALPGPTWPYLALPGPTWPYLLHLLQSWFLVQGWSWKVSLKNKLST